MSNFDRIRKIVEKKRKADEAERRARVIRERKEAERERLEKEREQARKEADAKRTKAALIALAERLQIEKALNDFISALWPDDHYIPGRSMLRKKEPTLLERMTRFATSGSESGPGPDDRYLKIKKPYKGCMLFEIMDSSESTWYEVTTGDCTSKMVSGSKRETCLSLHLYLNECRLESKRPGWPVPSNSEWILPITEQTDADDLIDWLEEISLV